MTTENMRDPGGAIQTFEPRPRPATWVVAVRVKPVGSLETSLGFLQPSCLSADFCKYRWAKRTKRTEV